MASRTFCQKHNINFYTEEGCPHCQEEKTVIERSDRKEADDQAARQYAVKSPLHTRKTAAPVACEVHGTPFCGVCNLDGPPTLNPNMMSPCENHNTLNCPVCGPGAAPNPNPMFQGYRELNALEIDRINRIKEVANVVRSLCMDLSVTQYSTDGDASCEPDPRWIAIAETHLQLGFMALTRAIAKPTSF